MAETTETPGETTAPDEELELPDLTASSQAIGRIGALLQAGEKQGRAIERADLGS